MWRDRLRRGVRAGRTAYKAFKVARSLANTVKNVQQSYKRKRPNKETKGKKKHKKQVSQPTKSGNHSWQTTVTWGKFRGKLPKAIRQNHPLNIWVDQNMERIANADEGRQAVNLIPAFASLFTLGNLQTFFGVGGSSTNAAQRRYLRSGSIKMMATNNTNQNCKVTVYNVTLKSDMKFATTANPLTAWQQGYVTEGATTAAQQYMGSTPYDSGYFGSLFTIWKTTNYFLSQGDSFVHTTNVHINKEIPILKVWNLTNEPLGTTSAAGQGGLKGITQWLITTIQLFPSHETTLNTNITTSIGALDVVYLNKGSFAENVQDSKEYASFGLLSNVPASALQVINTDTGAEVATFAG